MKKGKVVRLVPKPKDEDYCFIKIEGPPNGPFEWSSDKVTPCLLLIMRQYLTELENELFEIIQGEGDEEDAQ